MIATEFHGIKNSYQELTNSFERVYSDRTVNFQNLYGVIECSHRNKYFAIEIFLAFYPSTSRSSTATYPVASRNLDLKFLITILVQLNVFFLYHV